ncbi:LutC/YkgG family protein [Pseudalkalibacillus decolorationis]|uniref:LutC/YkgG family protein n=1 Tax=Pseudalkalibacillus decolorationis TaxID=163879 RepID=UPI002147E3E4|nr:lactate utilization protein C [Pseudalkalibacillus decolorationis]
MKNGAVHNKEQFLNQIAKSLGRERRTTPVARPQWKHQPQWNVLKNATEDELLDVLGTQCDRIHTRVETTTCLELNNMLTTVIEHFDAKSIVSWDDPRFKEYGINDYYENAGRAGVDVHIWDPSIGEKNIIISERADVGITFADITLAESGTVVLFSDNGKGRSVSLLPTNYIAIIPKSTIVPRMTQATHYIHKMEQENGNVPSCINFISGPSNSADIEMNLVVGVHGPITATYIVVTDR